MQTPKRKNNSSLLFFSEKNLDMKRENTPSIFFFFVKKAFCEIFCLLYLCFGKRSESVKKFETK